MEQGLDLSDINTILESLDYSKDRVRNSADTPNDIRTVNLQRLDAVSTKLRQLKKTLKNQ
jgi:hypothetical protein